MLRLPRFGVQAPESLDDVVAALAQPGARLLAGGTDLLPNLKHRLEHPRSLVSLARVRELRDVEEVGPHGDSPGVFQLGAGITLAEIGEHPRVRALFPSLATAAGLVASPLVRNMGTLGGNLNLDTRCRYVNQTTFWRSAIGGCLKSEGDVCHVVPKGRVCVAAMSSDLVPVLCSLGAHVVNVGSAGRREMSLLDYYGSDGTRHTRRLPDEVTVQVRIPIPDRPSRAQYAKWTVRESIDFPLVSVALRFGLAEDSVHAAVTDLSVVVGVLASRPRLLTRLDHVVGKPLCDAEVAAAVAERAFTQCKPLENVPYDAPYRRQMIRVHTRRAIEAMVDRG